LGLDRAALEPGDAQLEAPVVEQQGVADLDVVDEALVGDPDALDVAGAVVVGGEVEGGALLQGDLALGEAHHADLRPLQVLQDAHREAELLGDGTDVEDGLPVQLLVAVREVDAEDVHARLQQLRDPLALVRGRPQGRDDAGAAVGDVHRSSAPRPRKRAASPSSCSICSRRLYLAVRSERLAEPVLICPAFTATARSAMKVSSVSPERWLMTLR